MKKSRIYWIGSNPAHCDFCDWKFHSYFFDMATKSDGPYKGFWGCGCPKCHKELGIGMGTGKAQKYKKERDGKWYKIA